VGRYLGINVTISFFYNFNLAEILMTFTTFSVLQTCWSSINLLLIYAITILGSNINICFLGTFSTLTSENKEFALYSSDNMSFIRLNALAVLFWLRHSVYPDSSFLLLGLLITFVNNFPFNCNVCIFVNQSTVISLISTKKTRFIIHFSFTSQFTVVAE